MNVIDWDALKKTVADNENKIVDEKNNKGEISGYSIEIDGVSIFAELKKSDNPNNNYALKKRLLAYYKHYQCTNYNTDEVRGVYKSIFDFLISDYTHLCNSMKEDIKELDICFSSGAYKATLILAGSILEAFLLDWLSEIDGKDYFKESYKIKVYNQDGSYRWEKREQLNTYIDQIKEIERPDWMESSKKAHFIRESRNSVHAKVCLKKDIGINQETCKKVIDYLKDIIDTRLEKRKEELDI